MPGKIWVKVHGARELPVMDKSADTTDAFVEVRFNPSPNVVYKTDVCPKTLSPRWETEWMTFEAEDHEIQDESVLLRIMDYDTYSANDAIGRIYFDLNPLLEAAQRLDNEKQFNIDSCGEFRLEEALSQSLSKLNSWTQSAEMTGWLPILDTINGPVVPQGYKLAAVHGFVDELLVAGDPDYQWLDKIRTPRATNEARQGMFRKLSSELLRKLGRKSLGLGGNAVIGCKVSFDLEGQSTGLMSIRGLGTAVTLRRLCQIPLKIDVGVDDLSEESTSCSGRIKQSPHFSDVVAPPRRRRRSSRSSTASMEGFQPSSISPEIRSSGLTHQTSLEEQNLMETVIVESPENPETPVKKVLKPRPSPIRAATVTEGATVGTPPVDSVGVDSAGLQVNFAECYPYTSHVVQESARGPELPFITMEKMPRESVTGYGGVVCARSVRLLEDVEHKEGSEAADVRSEWWVELREELRSHMKALACNAVIGYREDLSLKDGICILSVMGTAVLVDEEFWSGKFPRADYQQEKAADCSFCHIAYSLGGKCFARALYRCSTCRDAHVPDLILATCEPHVDREEQKPRLIQVSVVRKLVHSEGEELAREISNLLPFVEHELHGSLLKELQSLEGGRNAVFSMRIAVAVGEGALVAVSTGTAVQLSPLVLAKERSEDDSISGGKLSNDASTAELLDLVADRNAACIVIDHSEQNEILHRETDTGKDFLANTAASILDRDFDLSRKCDYASEAKQKKLAESSNEENSVLNENSADRSGNTEFRCPHLCLRLWTGPLCLSGSIGESREICSVASDSWSLKLRIDWLLKSSFYKYKRQLRKVGGSETEVILKHVMFSVDISEESDNPEVHLRFCGMIVSDVMESGEPGKWENVVLSTLPPPFKEGWAGKCLGHYDLVLIRETNSLREIGGMGNFIRLAAGDVFHAVRSQVKAYKGEGLFNLRFTLNELNGSASKNHAQCLIGVIGDIVVFKNLNVEE